MAGFNPAGRVHPSGSWGPTHRDGATRCFSGATTAAWRGCGFGVSASPGARRDFPLGGPSPGVFPTKRTTTTAASALPHGHGAPPHGTCGCCLFLLLSTKFRSAQRRSGCGGWSVTAGSEHAAPRRPSVSRGGWRCDDSRRRSDVGSPCAARGHVHVTAKRRKDRRCCTRARCPHIERQ